MKRAAPLDGRLSSGYGERRPGNVWHAGWDIAAPAGAVVRSPVAGVVVAVEKHDRAPFRGYGPGTVLIRGIDGLFHLLGHLDTARLPADPRGEDLFTPGAGATVDVGSVVGALAPIRGPHVHWEVRHAFIAPRNQRPIHITVPPDIWLGKVPSSSYPRPRPGRKSGGAGKAIAWLAILYFLS